MLSALPLLEARKPKTKEAVPGRVDQGWLDDHRKELTRLLKEPAGGAYSVRGVRYFLERMFETLEKSLSVSPVPGVRDALRAVKASRIEFLHEQEDAWRKFDQMTHASLTYWPDLGIEGYVRYRVGQAFDRWQPKTSFLLENKFEGDNVESMRVVQKATKAFQEYLTKRGVTFHVPEDDTRMNDRDSIESLRLFLDWAGTYKFDKKVIAALRLRDVSVHYKALFNGLFDTIQSRMEFELKKADHSAREFEVDGLKVLMLPNAMSFSEGYVKVLKDTLADLKRKKLADVWYGKLLIGAEGGKDIGGSAEAYGKLGYDFSVNTKAAGEYSQGPDQLGLFMPYDASKVKDVLLHELGHRYWYKFLSRAGRAKFADLVATNAGSEGSHFGGQGGERDMEGFKKPVTPVSTYGKSNPEEAFAEVFYHYVMDLDMDRDQLESFRAALKEWAPDAASLAEAVAELLPDTKTLPVWHLSSSAKLYKSEAGARADVRTEQGRGSVRTASPGRARSRTTAGGGYPG